MNSSPLGRVLLIAGSLLLPPAVAGPTVGDPLTTTDGIGVDANPGSWEALRRAFVAPTVPERQASFAANAVPALDLASVAHGGARWRTAHTGAPASEATCTASRVVPGVHLALRIVAQQFGAPVTQLLDEYQAYRSSWQGRD